VKIPKTKARFPASDEAVRWNSFFDVADLCAKRSYTGNFAIKMMQDAFCIATEEEERWMRKILKKHLAIGASSKIVNKVFPGLISTFDVSLAQKFDEKRTKNWKGISVEPKLDGIRCFSVVKDRKVQMFARSGKLITNFDKTLGKILVKLGDGCYDGELMGEDFTALMRQAYRKESVDTTDTYLALFDYLPLREWKSRTAKMSSSARYKILLDKLSELSSSDLDTIIPVERYDIEANLKDVKILHDDFVSEGYEGAMIKNPDAPYQFGRSFDVMKFKAFHDVDLPIEGFIEGTGKHSGKLGSIRVVFNGVEVQVGSGFSDELREGIWNDQDNFAGRIVEIRYQEITPDGSLRFPTFVCFRNDRS
jgi:DNA ligase-1